MTPTDQRLREIEERVNKATDEMGKQRVRVAVEEISKMLPVNRHFCSQGQMTAIITKHCLHEQDHSRQDVPFLLALIEKQREALEQIAKPALGGKAQQYMAREALNFTPENL